MMAPGFVAMAEHVEAQQRFAIAADLALDEESHTYRLGTRVLPSVSAIIQGVGLVDLSGIPQDRLDFARVRGQAVHLSIRYLLEGDLDLDALDPQLVPYVTAFQAWREAVGFEPVLELVEQRLADPETGFAGTPDYPGTIRGMRVVVDAKAVYAMRPGYGPALAGYKRLLARAGFGAAARIGLQLKPDGTFTMHEYKDRHDDAVFQAALSLWHWKAERGLTQ